MAVCPQEELVWGKGGKSLGTVENLKEPGGVGSWEHQFAHSQLTLVSLFLSHYNSQCPLAIVCAI